MTTRIEPEQLVRWRPEALALFGGKKATARGSDIGRAVERLEHKGGKVSICVEWPDRELWTDEHLLEPAPPDAVFTPTAKCEVLAEDEEE